MRRIISFILIPVAFSLLAGCWTQPPLHNAVESSDINRVKALLDAGANVNEEAGATPLHIALFYDVSPDIVKLLLERGADVNKEYLAGARPIHIASARGNIEAVRLLIDRGADLRKRTSAGKTALAIAEEKGDAIMARMLREAEEKQYKKFFAKDEKYFSRFEEKTTIKSDIDELPSIKAKPNKNSYAIVIGIENYRQKLPKADYATSDAKTMTEYLTKAMGYLEENVVTLLNDHAAKSDMEKYFEKWLSNNVEKNSTVFIYYSGHGAPNPKTGDAYLVPYDGDPSFIAETGYSLKKLYENLGKLQAKEIIVALDSCFSGAGGRSVLAKGARPLVMQMETLQIPKKIAVLSAASGDQISSTYEEKGHGLFTYFMLKGIKGEADVDGDGRIEIGELFDYIKPQVERIARKTYNNEQTPQLIAPEKEKMFLRN